MTPWHWNLIEAGSVAAIITVAAALTYFLGRSRSRPLGRLDPLREKRPVGAKPLTGPTGKKREWMIWTGDGMAPAGPHLVGCPVDFDGRKGVVVDTTLLTVLVEWED